MSFDLVQVMFTFSELCGLTVMNPAHSDEFLQLGCWYEQDLTSANSVFKNHSHLFPERYPVRSYP